MKAIQVDKLLRDLAHEVGVANIAEALGKECEHRAIAEHGGAPDSVAARLRKAWQKAARALAQVAVDLRLEC